MATTSRFDADYYRRFYGDRRTRVVAPADIQALAGFVVAYMRYLGLPLRTALDLGCGLGHWRKALRRLAPQTRYTGVEFSEHLCGKLGWTRGSVVDFVAPRPADLVICQGVLQYLDDRDAARAIQNLGRLCGGALYVEALTRRDWQRNCDRTVTDGDVHLRTADWYRKRLRRRFHDVGGGVFVAKSCPVTLFELEHLP